MKDVLPKLELPKRWEALKDRSKEANFDPSAIVEKVEVASKYVDGLLRDMVRGSIGQFSVIFGKSGSGKTTFISTLPKFFDNVEVLEFDKSKSLSELISFIRAKYIKSSRASRIILITQRDNPSVDVLAQLDDLFADLVDFFRTEEGRVLVLWSVTKEAAAKEIAEKAWESGRDSMCSAETRGLYNFLGLEKEKYPVVADRTALSLFGDDLSAFGISQEAANKLTSDAETISEYLGKVNESADAIRGEVWTVLKEKVIPKLWVVVPADSSTAIEQVVRALTQGSRGIVDISLMQEYIDNASEDVQYVKEWRKLRARFPHLMRVLDVRVFSLPPNVSVLAARAFGSDVVKKELKQRNTVRATAMDALRATRLYKEVMVECGFDVSKYAGPRGIKQETENEFLRIQRLASSDDKPLNKALGNLIEAAMRGDGFSGKVIAEKRALFGTGLQPDIMVEVDEKSYICIEPTWRSTGRGIEGVPQRQPTLTEAHIKNMLWIRHLSL